MSNNNVIIILNIVKQIIKIIEKIPELSITCFNFRNKVKYFSKKSPLIVKLKY
jgi:hypothetical protein